MSDKPEYWPSVEENFERFVADGGVWPTAAEWRFINEMRRAAEATGFGWMMKVIEWEWNHRRQRNEAHTSYLGQRCDELQKQIRDADAALVALGIPDDGRPLAERVKALATKTA